MKTLTIKATHITPEVCFDNERGCFELAGMSLPEDSFNFYKPLLDWVVEYSAYPAAQTELVFKMEYFNTSSTAYILKLMKEVGRLNQQGNKTLVKWYHDFEDDDMSEAGKGLAVLANVPIQLVGYKAD